jgi:membrane protein DedA with SNARE-associated domain
MVNLIVSHLSVVGDISPIMFSCILFQIIDIISINVSCSGTTTVCYNSSAFAKHPHLDHYRFTAFLGLALLVQLFVCILNSMRRILQRPEGIPKKHLPCL